MLHPYFYDNWLIFILNEVKWRGTLSKMWFVKPINVIDCTGLVHSITPLPRTLTLGSLGAMMISVVSFNEYSQAHESFAI